MLLLPRRNLYCRTALVVRAASILLTGVAVKAIVQAIAFAVTREHVRAALGSGDGLVLLKSLREWGFIDWAGFASLILAIGLYHQTHRMTRLLCRRMAV
jgi:hypothetical protein